MILGILCYDERTPQAHPHNGPPLRISGPKERQMGKKAPWHSVKQSVYHNHTDCNTGNNIEKDNLRQGTGGKHSLPGVRSSQVVPKWSWWGRL